MTGDAHDPASPVRSCVGCGARRPQAELVRFRAVAGVLEPGRGPGRGAYTCRDAACLERALGRRAFSRRLRAEAVAPPDLAVRAGLVGEPD